MKFPPSKYQSEIIQFGKESVGNGRVNAVAGSGKSTTLMMFLQEVDPKNALLVAFNKPIAVENQNKLDDLQLNANSKTVHAIGFSMLRGNLGERPNVNAGKGKVWDLAENVVDRFAPDKETQNAVKRDLKQLVDLARLNLKTDVEGITDIAEHHQVLASPEMIEIVPELIEQSDSMALDHGHIDFVDMIWLPVKMNLTTYTNEWVLVDECQDLSPAQLEIALKCVNPDNGRSLFVGDEFQAIYGFAGADSDSFHEIKRRTDATDLPLSISYRCPSSHIDLARQIVPQIEARDGAPEGIVEDIQHMDLIEKVKPGDLVLCRFTAPLIKDCISMIKHRLPAKVKGRDIGQQIIQIVENVSRMTGYSFGQFHAFLEAYRLKQEGILMQKKASTSVIEAFHDKILAVDVCATEFDSSSTKDLIRQINGLFADDNALIWLSTVHRAKGLESERVFITEPSALPFSRKGQAPWQFQQERNLQYVAYTRSKSEMYFVHPNSKG